ncbi:unnamed protein product (macronuclear) [Paramecium tetraurelia]|uniref:Cyclic nucleotide-binding domain-containing protein n=1 Tax=Paramecium tetraurelia TaxID=5888 RepID=A0DSX5_PARTE|nr:uncharacterized protein GSPATT00019835001 [Paramecium tetraurelia]CAK86142.1 unnamed protein product [Paramecium tetraurelia]|eukprot:XP_001453539.1 hypothetical protein (macronuclear) [Paramecium tetraurelia strain d4-2]
MNNHAFKYVLIHKVKMKQSNQKPNQQEQLLKQQLQIEALLSKALEYFINPKQQNEQLVDSLLQIQFFKNNCPEGTQLKDFVMQTTKHAKYECFSYGQIIFNYGDFGDKMYIILKGQAGVYIPKSQEQIQEELAQENLKKNRRMLFLDDPLYENRDNPIYYQDGIFRFQKVFQYISGQCFGDVALTSDKPRTASLIVLSDILHCISINRIQYKLICDKAIQEQKKAMSLYSKIFPGIQPFIIQKFVQYLRPIKFTSQSILWQAGDEPQNLLIIVSGRVDIYTKLDDQKQLKNRVIPNNLFNIVLKKVILSQITDGGVVGQEELIEELPKRKYNCQCVDNTSAYYMEAEEFRKIRKNFPQIVNLLKEIQEKNNQYISQRYQQMMQSIQNCQNSIVNTTSNQQTPVPFDELIDVQKKHIDQSKVLRSGNKKLLTLSQSVRRNQKAFQLKYKDKLQKDLLVPNSELQQNIQKEQEKLFYMNNRHLQQKSKQELSLSNEIKNFKLNLSKSQSKFNQTEENFENIISFQHQYQLTDGSSLSPSKILQFYQSSRRESYKKYQNLLNIQPSNKPNTLNKNISLSLRHFNSLHSQSNIKKRIQTDQSDINEQQHQLLFITSCRNKYEKSPKSFPKLLLIEDDNN